MTAENTVRSPSVFKPSAAPRAGLLWGRKARMTIHFSNDCPAMESADATADTEKFTI